MILGPSPQRRINLYLLARRHDSVWADEAQQVFAIAVAPCGEVVERCRRSNPATQKIMLRKTNPAAFLVEGLVAIVQIVQFQLVVRIIGCRRYRAKESVNANPGSAKRFMTCSEPLLLVMLCCTPIR